jgi:hypothetical protein
MINKKLSLFFIVFVLCIQAFATEGYYKDLFSDGGCRLAKPKSLPAAKLLGLSVEYLATANPDVESKIMIQSNDPNWKDDNGVLLYPDGQPRFRCLFSNGGKSIEHGQSLGEIGRQRVRDFFFNGGSYTGSCAGAAIVTIAATTNKGYDKPREEYYHIWPAHARYTGLAKSHTDITIPKTSPLLKYYDFGGDFRIQNLRHNGGNYTIENDNYWWCPKTEVLAEFADPIVGDDHDHNDFVGHVNAWAYKKDNRSGRLAVCGSHPEKVEDGEIRDFQAALLQYAMAGNGDPVVKAQLQNHSPRRMSDNHKIGFEKIGDLQYHHFTIDLPAGAKNLKITLRGQKNVDLNLYLKKGDFAFKGSKDVIEAQNTESSQETISLDNPDPGTWYIGVKCNEAVKGQQQKEFFQYTDNLQLLNGTAYMINASWNEKP